MSGYSKFRPFLHSKHCWEIVYSCRGRDEGGRHGRKKKLNPQKSWEPLKADIVYEVSVLWVLPTRSVSLSVQPSLQSWPLSVKWDVTHSHPQFNLTLSQWHTLTGNPCCWRQAWRNQRNNLNIWLEKKKINMLKYADRSWRAPTDQLFSWQDCCCETGAVTPSTWGV